MGEIQAPLGEIEGVGAGIEAVAPSLATLTRAATGVSGTVSDPPATAAALDRLAGRWAASAPRLEDEIAALGVAAGATAVAYRVADESSMTGGPR
jgi:short subunit fatty acids transporter